MMSIFSRWASAFLLWKHIYSVLMPIFKLGCTLFFTLSCINSFYMLGINSFSVISFANIFSHSVDCLLILSMVSFAVQKLLSLIRSHLSIFAFSSFALGDESKKYCYDLPQRVFCLCFSPGFLWFLVLHLGL